MKVNRPTAAQKRRWGRVADLGCMDCGQPAEIHHCETGGGGRKDHDKVIGLCFNHHRSGVVGLAIHSSRKLWQNVYGTEQELMQKVADLLCE